MVIHEREDMTLIEIANNPELLEVGRRAIEDALIEYRQARISYVRGNGLVIREMDGRPSDVIRLGPEDALRIGLLAIAEHLTQSSLSP